MAFSTDSWGIWVDGPRDTHRFGCYGARSIALCRAVENKTGGGRLSDPHRGCMHSPPSRLFVAAVLCGCIAAASLFAAPVAPEPPMAPLPPEPVIRRLPSLAPPPPASSRLGALRGKIARTVAAYERRPLNTLAHNPWEVMHWALAYGAKAKLKVGSAAGDPVDAFGWLNQGRRCNGLVMVAAEGDRVIALRGKGMQGHVAQYLAVMAQARLPPLTPLMVGGKQYTIADLIETEQRGCREKSELTFVLIAMAHYLDTDEKWRSDDGTEWSLPKLVKEELAQPLRGAPCGGSHRLFGLAYACQKRREAIGKLDGIYVTADRYVRGQQQRMFDELQNRDGSFSTDWFNKPEDNGDVERKLRTTGHMLEFLVSTADQPVLYHPRTIDAVELLTDVLHDEPDREWKIGPMCHGLHALIVYQERVWGSNVPGALAAYHGPMKARKAPAQKQSADSRGSILPVSLPKLFSR
jgi:hypothetical protein